MELTTITSRTFNQDASGAKRAAQNGPVFITDRGKPAHVLLSIEEYQYLTGKQQNMVDLLAMPAGDTLDFEPPRLSGKLYQPAELL